MPTLWKSLTEYAVSMRLVSEPAFAWWVPYTIKKRDRVIKALKKRYFRQFQKYGIELHPRQSREPWRLMSRLILPSGEMSLEKRCQQLARHLRF
jgi:hypothetical protein